MAGREGVIWGPNADLWVQSEDDVFRSTDDGRTVTVVRRPSHLDRLKEDPLKGEKRRAGASVSV